MYAVTWILTGIVAGWLARLALRRRSYGVTGDLILGSLGGLIGGWALRLAGVTAPHLSLRHILAAFLGSILVLGLARLAALLMRVTPGLTRQMPPIAALHNLDRSMRRLGVIERRAITRLLRRRPSSVTDPNAAFDAQLTFGQRVADRVAYFGGSWTFIGFFGLVIVVWMIANTEMPLRFDPYPFILLNLVLSCLAALQAPIIMMSQNRQAVRDRLDAKCDYEVNLKAEMEIMMLHSKLDEAREREWQEILAIQKRQMELLERLERTLTADEGR